MKTPLLAALLPLLMSCAAVSSTGGPPPGDAEARAMAAPLTPHPDAIQYFTPERLRAWEQTVRFKRGEAADIDGDGRKESVGKWVNGVFTFEIDENGDGRPDEVSDGTTITTDLDFDGSPDMIETRTPGRLVIETDQNEDGVRDERSTTEQINELEERIRIERRKTPDGPWELEEDYVAPRVKGSGQAPQGKRDVAACTTAMLEAFPQDTDGPALGTEAYVIPYGRGAKRCTLEQARHIDGALQCALGRIPGCLGFLNPRVAKGLSAVLNGRRRRVVVACNNPCPGTVANTIVGQELSLTALDMEGVWGDRKACETVVHEGLHAAGVPVPGNHDEAGTDTVYSCSRVCTGCEHSSPGAGDDRKDCARCAVAGRKEYCGSKLRVTGLSVMDPARGCFHLTNPSTNPVKCAAKQVVTLSCDNVELTHLPPTACCNTCPDGYGVGTGHCGDIESKTNFCRNDPPLWMCQT